MSNEKSAVSRKEHQLERLRREAERRGYRKELTEEDEGKSKNDKPRKVNSEVSSENSLYEERIPPIPSLRKEEEGRSDELDDSPSKRSLFLS